MIIAQIVPPSDVAADPLEWPWYLFAVATSGVLGWGIRAWRDKEEIRKLRSEVTKLDAEVNKLNAEEVKLAGDNLREIQRARDTYSEACRNCGECAKKIIKLIESSGDETQIRNQRDTFGSILSHQAFPALCSHVEWQSLNRKSDPSALIEYIRSDVIPEIDRLRGWVKIINIPLFTSDMSLTHLQIQERTMRPFRDLMRFIPKDRHSEIREQLYNIIMQVTET